MVRSLFHVCFVSVACAISVVHAFRSDDDKGSPQNRPMAWFQEAELAPAMGPVTETSEDRFARAMITAAKEQVAAGKLKRLELLKLRVALMSPAFRRHAEDLAVTQMAFSGAEFEIPTTESGAVDRASIDWDKLLAFLKEFIPLLLELIKAI